MPAKTFLVTGCTGNQGGAVADALLGRGHRVRGLTRVRGQPEARALAERGVDIVEGDFNDPDAMRRAARGVDGAFLMGTPFEAGPEAETRGGIRAANAFREAGVPHLVYSSVANADRDTGIPHFDSKRAVEEHLQGLGLPYTITAPVFFMENLFAPWMAPALQQGQLAMPLPGRRSLQMIALRNIGEFNALVLEQREPFLGRRIDLASDEVTGGRAAEVLSGATGRRVAYREVPLAQARAQSEDTAKMWDWFQRQGYSADIDGLRRDHPEVAWQRFEEWAQAQDWSILQRAPARPT